MAIDHVDLGNELNTDPRGYGYAPHIASGNDNELARLLNLPRDGSAGTVPSNPTADGGNPDGTIKIDQEEVDTGEIRASVTFEGFDGLVAAEQTWFEWLTANGFITVNAHLLQKLAGIPTATQSIWAVADRTAMNAAMEALMRKFASRGEERYGINTNVTSNDISEALRGG